ncbi:MAG TPA: hypothetical protein VNZ58_09040 [Thermomicrobiales bacterium]|nr:hypothetical protein [Thermomicrobiales bacterium]
MNQGRLYDLEEMVHSCREAVSRINIEEAINAYRAGAFRSAIISTWIAVYFDLTTKIRSLSLAGDEQATRWIRHFDEKLVDYNPENPDTTQPFQAIERQILNDAHKKFELIGSIELTELKRLRSDRHRCAHPTMRTSQELFTPSPELVRTHIRSAIEYVLSMPAIQGKLAVDRTMELLRDEGFPISASDAQEVLRESSLQALVPDELLAVLNALVSDLLGPDTTGTQRLQRIGAIEAIRFLLPNTFQELFGESITIASAPNKLEFWNIITAMIRSRSWVLAFVGGLERGRIVQTVQEAPATNPDLQSLVISCLYIEPFQPVATKKLQSIPLGDITRLREAIPVHMLLREAAQRLADSGGVESTYPIMTQLIEPNVRHLKRQQVQQIMDAYKTNKHVRESYAAYPLLEKMLMATQKQQLGTRYQWIYLLQQLTDWSDSVKASLSEWIDAIFPQDDLDSVPF